MLKNLKIKITLALLLVIFIIFNFNTNINTSNLKSLAGVFFYNSITNQQLKIKYNLAKNNATNKIKILIVPGHEDKIGGTSYAGVRESELNIELAEYVAVLLSQENRFDVKLLRSRDGYNEEFLTYLETQKEDILNFRQDHKDKMDTLIDRGFLDLKKGVEHITALPEMVAKLYGVNKWSNDINVDIVIHIHFNDYPERRHGRLGKYTGFSIYIPEKQYSNYEVSYSLAEEISNSMSRFFATSDYPDTKREKGIVEDQELIAIGAFNTLNSASLLMEYGFIYESQFINKNTREVVLKEMAVQTYVGIKRYFDKEIAMSIYNLPYVWKKDLNRGIKNNKDVFALQTYLASVGLYPPYVSDLNNCPISGSFGGCTFEAVKEFQLKNNINSSGVVDLETRKKLNYLVYMNGGL